MQLSVVKLCYANAKCSLTPPVLECRELAILIKGDEAICSVCFPLLSRFESAWIEVRLSSLALGLDLLMSNLVYCPGHHL